MRGNGDWVTNARPENWRQMILRLFPNGMAPLTAIMSMLPSENTNDPTIHWWTQNLATQSGATAGSGVYTTSTMAAGTAYASGGATNDVLYVKVAQAVATQFRIGHTVALEEDGDYRTQTRARVVSVDPNGASSGIGVKLLETPSATYDLDGVNRITIIGSAHAEGADRPDAVAYDPVEYYNYTQIFRTPLSITNTARATNLRTGDGYQEAKKDSLQYHSIEMEKGSMFGLRSSGTGSNGKPLRTMDGIVTMLKRESSTNGNVEAFGHVAPYNTNDWTTLSANLPLGELWLDEKLEVIFRYGSNEKMALCGSGAMLGIQKLAKVTGTINLTPMSVSYGLKVLEWITPFGTLYLKTHPLMSQNPQYRYDALIVEPERLKWRPLAGNGVNRDTKFIPASEAGAQEGRDSTEEEYLTEGTLEGHHLPTMGYLSRLGLAHDDTIPST